MLWQKLLLDLEEFKNSIGINEVGRRRLFQRRKTNHSSQHLDVNGIWGGYTGEGAKTVIPVKHMQNFYAFGSRSRLE